VRAAVSNQHSASSNFVLIVISLFTFSACAAPHANSKEQMGHHTGSSAAAEAAGASETQDWAKQRLAKSPAASEVGEC
jgi:hypothetical protein